MKLRYLGFPLSLLLPSLLLLPTLAQKREQIDDVRDAFLVTRQRVTTRKNSKPADAGSKQRPPALKLGHARKPLAPPIGVGYTVYQRDATGNPVRVTPEREFRQGDAVRLVFETNTDGYLYVFHVENDGPARMIFPDARLNGGNNHIQAHVPYEVPSSKEPNPHARWFVFDDKPALERLYVVVAKTPLPQVPIGGRLVARCRADAPNCSWRPAATTWSRLATSAANPLREVRSNEFGQLLTAVETQAVERGIGLGLDAPAPSVIKVNHSAQAKQLVTMIALTHK